MKQSKSGDEVDAYLDKAQCKIREPSGVAELKQIANIAHHGALLGFGDNHSAMNEIRRLTRPWWNR